MWRTAGSALRKLGVSSTVAKKQPGAAQVTRPTTLLMSWLVARALILHGIAPFEHGSNFRVGSPFRCPCRETERERVGGPFDDVKFRFNDALMEATAKLCTQESMEECARKVR